MIITRHFVLNCLKFNLLFVANAIIKTEALYNISPEL